MGVIYILTNPSFPKYVKIGYADDVEKRLRELNRTECIPFAFRLYAYYEVNERLTDLKLHDMIDKINPSLRSVDTFNGKPRKKEFYQMSKEIAYNILESIASISNTLSKLHLVEKSQVDSKEEADEIDKTTYDIPSFLANKREPVKELYNKLTEKIKVKLPTTYQEATPNYIALRNEDRHNVCEIHLYKNKLMILTKVPENPELMIGKKVPDDFLWALNYRVEIEKEEQLDTLVQILISAYNQIKK